MHRIATTVSSLRKFAEKRKALNARTFFVGLKTTSRSAVAGLLCAGHTCVKRRHRVLIGRNLCVSWCRTA